jgi:hypothetical protein
VEVKQLWRQKKWAVKDEEEPFFTAHLFAGII